MTDRLAPLDRATLIDTLAQACALAGEAILAVRAAGFAVATKADRSPVTAADEAAEAILLAALALAAPGVPVISEEAASAGRMPATGRRFFLVDPLDGTREFVAGGDDFTVNVALIEDGVPVLGIVGAPARAELYAGDLAVGAWRATVEADGAIGPRRAIAVRPRPNDGPVAVASRSHRTPETDAWLAAHGVAATVAIGSSLKLCLIAAGEADLYPRLGPTMAWDIAAGDAVLRAAGGRTTTLDGTPLAYRGDALRNPHFVARA